MAKELPNIEYKTDGKTSVIDSPDAMYVLTLTKNEEYFSNLDSRTRFLKACEKLVHVNPRYSKYKKKLMKEVGLDHCQVLSSLTDKDCTIEMHHGPIFTLYDICDIVLDHYLQKGYKITTYRIAKEVLDDHWKNLIQVVMVSTSMHQEIHDREMFINVQQAWGNLPKFLKKYTLSDELKEKYNRYLDRSMMLDSTTYDILKLNDKLINGGK